MGMPLSVLRAGAVVVPLGLAINFIVDPKSIRVAVDMCRTCKYVQNMPKMIQVRNVPDSLHRKLKIKGCH